MRHLFRRILLILAFTLVLLILGAATASANTTHGFDNGSWYGDVTHHHRAAGEVTQNLIIGKAYVVGEGNGVVFSAEFIGDSYVYFRDNLKQLLTVLQEAQQRFFQTLDSLKKKREEEREAVFSGKCFVQDSAVARKVQS